MSVPQRDFAAALVGCGWVLASEAPTLAKPLEALRTMEPGQPVRAVNKCHVITGLFSALDERVSPPRARFAGSTWNVDSIQAIAPLDRGSEVKEPLKERRPHLASIEHLACLDDTWDARLALPAADLAFVGTQQRLREDFDAYLAREADSLPPSSIKSLLRPKTDKTATWFTYLYPSASILDYLPLLNDLRAVILDGNNAIMYLGKIEAPVVICVLDRSVADESAAELVMQTRNTRGKPVSCSHDLNWSPPLGVEVLAFTVAL